MLIDKNQPRLQWAWGKITAIYQDAEGIIREVTVHPLPKNRQGLTTTPRRRAVQNLILIKRAFSDHSHKETIPSDENKQMTALATKPLLRPCQQDFKHDDSWYRPATEEYNQHRRAIIQFASTPPKNINNQQIRRSTPTGNKPMKVAS